MSEPTFEDYKQRVNIQDLLIDAGYTLNKRDGLRYPAYVRLDSNGKKIPGDKFIVTANGLCCFKPPVIKNFNVISFITEHPELFADYRAGMDKHRLVHLVCCRLLNQPVENIERNIVPSKHEVKPFNIQDYKIRRFQANDWDSQKQFCAFFKPRGIDLRTQCAFRHWFVLAERQGEGNVSYKNLSFPMYLPGKIDKCVGFEERGFINKDGKSYRGMAQGSNASEGLWMGSPNNTPLNKAEHVLWFESAYDAMAYYQLHIKDNPSLKNAVFLSTGGNPSVMQFNGVLKITKEATHHLCFDNDLAGNQYVMNFRDAVSKFRDSPSNVIPNDMKPFIDKLGGRMPTSKELNYLEDELYFELPEDLKKAYRIYDSAVEEAYSCQQSSLVCQDDKKAAADFAKSALEEFKKLVFERLKTDEQSSVQDIKINREIPTGGYKDFNDELLNKQQNKCLSIAETASKGNSTDGPLKIKEENEETKHHGFRR